MAQKGGFNFYKIFCTETCSSKLEIPSCTESERRDLNRKVLLRNRKMKVWMIEISEIGDAMFFEDGWEKVVENNSIINGDQLFFMYNGNNVYDFFVVDPMGCEKIVVEGQDARVVEMRREGVEDVFVLEVDIHHTLRKEVKKEEEDDDHPLPQDMDATEEEDDDDDDDDITLSQENRHNSGGSRRDASDRRGAAIPEHFGADLFRSGRYIQPDNAYFVARIRPKRPGNLYIPMEVIKDYNLVLPPTVTLRDSKGREWTSVVKVWADGRTWLSRGWLNLCKRNFVAIEDRCICEFLPQAENNNKMVLQVTIVKEDAANEE